MDANELRIGNYVYDSTDHCRIDVKCSDFCYSGNFEPIKLTEEWLLKFGFEKLAPESFRFNCLEIDIEIEIAYLVGDGNENIIYLLDDIKYLHQLQNLYFALTNEELTIK